MVIGIDHTPTLPMEGTLPPDLQGTIIRIGPAHALGATASGAGISDPAQVLADGSEANGTGPTRGTTEPDVDRGALHAVELRDGKAVSYLRRESPADAGVFWHAGNVLALPETGMPSQYSRLLVPEEFSGALTVPIASHVHRVAADGSRVLFAVDDRAVIGTEDGAEEGIFFRLGEWDARGALRSAQAVPLERATWQHDVGVTEGHVVFIESPTKRLVGVPASTSPVPFGWDPGAEGWLGVVPRSGDGSELRWIRLDPCLVTHVLGAMEVMPSPPNDGGPTTRGGGADAAIELYVCRYDVPEAGQRVDDTASVVAPPGIGLSPIGGNLGVLERWRVVGDTLEVVQLDERHVEYPRIDAACEGARFRHGYGVELALGPEAKEQAGTVRRQGQGRSGAQATPIGLLKFDLGRDEVTSWQAGPGRRPSEPIFVRAADGHGDDEGWLLTVVDDPDRGASDLYVLDASALGRRRPEAIIHLPERLPFRSHGEWVPADQYR